MDLVVKLETLLKRGQNPKATSYSSLLWSGKSLWDHQEVRNNVKINYITKCLTPGIDDYLSVDNCCITSRSKYRWTSGRQLKQCILKMTHKANTNGCRISKVKIRTMHFYQLRKMYKVSLTKLEDKKIPVDDEYTFIGVIFDKNLTFISSIKYLKSKSTRA